MKEKHINLNRHMLLMLGTILCFMMAFVPMKQVRAEDSFPIEGYWQIGDDDSEDSYAIHWRLITNGSDTLELDFVDILTDTTLLDNGTASQLAGYKTVAYNNNKKITSVKISAQLTEIPKESFSGDNFDLTAIIIPASVEVIGMRAFAGNGRLELTEESLPAALKVIGTFAFNSCATKTMNLSTFGNLEEIGAYAFSNSPDLTSISLPNSLKILGDSAFYGCTDLTWTPSLPGSLEELGDYAFSGTKVSGNLSLPSGLKKLGNAFAGLTGVTGSITIPASVESISGYVFKGTSITTVNIAGGSINYIPADSFRDMGELTSVTIGSGIKEINDGAFANDTRLSSVTLGTGIKVIAGASFTGCTELKSITLPQGLQYIGRPDGNSTEGNEGAFSDTGLTEITIPNSVRYIGSAAFRNCLSLKKVVIKPGTEDVMIGLPLSYIKNEANQVTGEIDMSLYEDIGWIEQVGTGLQSVQVKDYEYISGGNMKINTSGANGSFYYCESLEEIWIPENVKYISENTFLGTPRMRFEDAGIEYTKLYCYYDSFAEKYVTDDIGMCKYDVYRSNPFGIIKAVILDKPQFPASLDRLNYVIKCDEESEAVTSDKITFDENYENAANAKKNLSYSSSDDSIARIDKKTGKITGTLLSGETNLSKEVTITVTNELTGASDSFTMRVKPKYVYRGSGATLRWQMLKEGDSDYVATGYVKSFTGAMYYTDETPRGYLNEDRYYPMKEASNLLPVGYDTMVEYNISIPTCSTGIIEGKINSIAVPDGYTTTDAKVVAVYGETGAEAVIADSNETNIVWNLKMPVYSEQAFISYVVALKKKDGTSGGETGTTTTPGGETGSGGTSGGDTGSGTTGGTGTEEKTPQVGTTEADSSGKATYKVSETAKDSSGNTVVEVSYVEPTASQKKATSVTIPDTVTLEDGTKAEVTEIAANAFKKNTKIKKVTVGSNVETIGANAFSGCSNLTTATIKGQSLEKVGDGAFQNCKKLTKVKLSNNVTTIGKNAFSGDKKLKEITINGNKIKKIGKNAFKGIKKNAKIIILAKNKTVYKKVVKMIKSSGAKNVKFVYKNKK